MKNKAPSFQFYPADWLNDIKLQSCKIASQGLLINLMCLMHQSEKYGFLLINGKKNDKKVAKIVRLTPKKFSNLIEDLVENGVLKISEDGTCYCERMVKDQALREIRRKAGKLGGNPNLLNQVDKQPDNQKTTPSSSSSSSDIPPPPGINDFVILFIDHIVKTKGNRSPKKTDKLILSSCDIIDKLIRLDNFTLDYIKQVIRFALDDSFWNNNVLSLAELRKKKGDLTKFQKIANSFESGNPPQPMRIETSLTGE